MGLKLKQRGNHWHIAGTVKGHEVRRSTGFTVAEQDQAELMRLELEADLLRKSMAEPGVHRTRSYTVRRLATEFMHRPEGVGGSDERRLQKLIDHFGDTPADRVNAGDLADFFMKHWGKAKPGTLKRSQAIVKSAWKRAVRLGRVPMMPHIEAPRVDDERKRALTVAERDRLIEVCEGPFEYMRPLVVFLLYTGARLGEATALRPEHFVKVAEAKPATESEPAKPAVWAVQLTSRKGGKTKTRTVPLHPDTHACVLQEVERARRNTRDEHKYVFVNRRGVKWSRGRDWGHPIYKVWDRIMKAAGIEDFRPHDCRHTFATLLGEAGADLDELRELLGHSDLKMVTRYKHTKPSKLSALVERL